MIAVLDLGTNTFNLLIADEAGTILFEHKIAVKLGSGGLAKKIITPDAFERGINAVNDHYSSIKKFQCENIKAFATSMVRDAENGKEFVDAIKKNTGIEVEIINGDREAELIWKGVKSAIIESQRNALSLSVAVAVTDPDFPDFPLEEKILIIDIGGGSTEFIIGDESSITWKKSYQLGVTRLFEFFNHSDPVSQKELNEIISFLSSELKDLFEEVNKYKITKLVGCSGSFESFLKMISWRMNNEAYENRIILKEIPVEEFYLLYKDLLYSSHMERAQMKGLIELRRDLIVLASIITNLVIDTCSINKLYCSGFALKEGALFELMENPRL